MALKTACPHCQKVLKVSSKAAGQTLPCPACNQPVAIPPEVESLDQLEPVAPHSGMHGVPLLEPTETPTPPPIYERLREAAKAHPEWTDLLLGRQKEFVFELMPGEQIIDELKILHRHLFFVHRGWTTVTLTDFRLLCSATRVFSPLYWLLVALFQPLIYYYVFRISRNRNVSIPLRSVDSVEKKYRPNWLLFILCILGTAFLGYCILVVIESLTDTWEGFTYISTVAQVFIYIVTGPLILLCLLKTRIVSIDVLTHSNVFAVRFGSMDRGVSEERYDAFIQKINNQIEHASSDTMQRVPRR